MGMLIRVAFNNQNWANKCKNANGDRRLFKCWKKVVNTRYKVDRKGNCLARCWESTLCTKYFWMNPLGNFNTEKAKGSVFFVYPDTVNSLVLWGRSSVRRIDGNKAFFKKFKPMSQERWIGGLSSKNMIGKNWGHGTHRYINAQIESKLERLIKNKLTKNGYFDDPIETEITGKEGRLSLRKHLNKERSLKLVSAFKQSLSSYKCSICKFNFEKTYGPIGKDFIEAHHVKTVSSLKEDEEVSIKDLVAVCSNCHRMIHRTNPPLDWRKLKAIKK